MYVYEYEAEGERNVLVRVCENVYVCENVREMCERDVCKNVYVCENV